MSLQASRVRLEHALQELLVRWDEVKARWDDAMSRDFEERHLRPLEPRIRNAMAAMEKMAEKLDRARRDCG